MTPVLLLALLAGHQITGGDVTYKLELFDHGKLQSTYTLRAVVGLESFLNVPGEKLMLRPTQEVGGFTTLFTSVRNDVLWSGSQAFSSDVPFILHYEQGRIVYAGKYFAEPSQERSWRLTAHGDLAPRQFMLTVRKLNGGRVRNELRLRTLNKEAAEFNTDPSSAEPRIRVVPRFNADNTTTLSITATFDGKHEHSFAIVARCRDGEEMVLGFNPTVMCFEAATSDGKKLLASGEDVYSISTKRIEDSP